MESVLNIHRKKINVAILAIVILNYFLPSILFVSIVVVLCLLYVFFSNYKFLNLSLVAYLLLMSFFLTEGLLYENDGRAIVRDVATFLTPLVYIIVGQYYSSNKETNVYKSLLYGGFGVSLIDRALKFSSNSYFTESNIGNVRENGFVGLSTIIALFILFFFQDKIYCISKKKKMLMTLVMITSIILSLSRTNLICFLIIVLGSLLKKLDLKKISYTFGGFFFIVLIIYATFFYLNRSDLLTVFFDKLTHSLTELSTDSRWTVETIQENWRGYETYMALEHFKQGNAFQFLFGYGFGEGIDVGGYANLVGISEGGVLPRLHNGYANLLIKTGFVGIIVYISFFVYVFIYAQKYTSNNNKKAALTLSTMILILTYFSAGIVVLNGFFFETIILLICILGERVQNENNSLIPSSIS